MFVLLDHRTVNGFAAARPLAPGDWLVVLEAARPAEAILNTAGHELGHVMRGHLTAGVDQEREAANMAASWGFTGPSADPDLRAEAFTPTPAPAVRATLTPDSIGLECSTCGSACLVVCPTVAGIAAEVGVGCQWCGTFHVLALRDLVPCRCGELVTVTWAEGATPEHPVATWACSCGTSATREIRELRFEDEAEWAFRLRRAAGTLHRVEDGLRRLEPIAEDFDRLAVPLESCLASVWWARRLILRAAQDLAADSRQALVQGVLSELAGASEALRQRHVSEAVGIVGRSAAAIDAILTQARGDGQP